MACLFIHNHFTAIILQQSFYNNHFTTVTLLQELYGNIKFAEKNVR